MVAGDYAKDRKLVMGVVATIISGLALSIGGYTTSQLIGQQTAIAVLQSDSAAFREVLREQKEAAKENNRLLLEVLQRIPRSQ